MEEAFDLVASVIGYGVLIVLFFMLLFVVFVLLDHWIKIKRTHFSVCGYGITACRLKEGQKPDYEHLEEVSARFSPRKDFELGRWYIAIGKVYNQNLFLG